MNEHLSKSEHELSFVRGDLRSALRTATAVEALIILPLIERAGTLARDIAALRTAREQS